MRGVLANRLRTAGPPNFAAQGLSVSRKIGADVPLTGLSFGFESRALRFELSPLRRGLSGDSQSDGSPGAAASASVPVVRLPCRMRKAIQDTSRMVPGESLPEASEDVKRFVEFIEAEIERLEGEEK